jgi:hypothetical protein
MKRGFAIVSAGMASLAAGCGGGDESAETDRVLQALRDQTQALLDRDTRTFCRKTFLSTDMPPSLAVRLGVPAGSGAAPDAWNRHYAVCVREFGKHGEFESNRPPRPPPDVKTLRRLVKVSIKTGGAAGISRTAKVTGPQRLDVHGGTLVKFRGDWKVVFEVN